ncbi:hypothetical protein N008_13480 [Hymenobacter sp. APR13]|nr:hypothetical protein N008_13480 [Hymenobacter sp. APR13]
MRREVYQFQAATGGPGRGFFLDTTIVGNTTTRDQVLGDLDNDGDLDLVTTGSLYGCRIFLNNGAGRFALKSGLVTAEEPSGVALADVDQDGDLDMLVSDAENSTVAVCLNDGTGEFIGSVGGAQNAPVGARPVEVAAGDVDGDGDLDFVTANADDGSATVRYNNGSLPLLYTGVTTVPMGAGPTSVALADIDNDGDLDLLTTNAGTPSAPSGSVSVSRNSGMGVFGSYTSVTVGLQPSDLALADVDGDGDLDLLTASVGTASVSLRLNNGSGTFTGTTTLPLPAGSTPSGLRTGDVDADGDLDVVVAQGRGGRVLTFLNTAGTFAQQSRALRLNRTPATMAVTTEGVTLGDVDGDLDLDLITSDNEGHVLLSRNEGPPPPLPSPRVTGLTPERGPVGTVVTITGTALLDIAAVTFNGVPAVGAVPNAAGTSLDVTVPAGASTGPVVVVTEEAGTATSPASYEVTLPVPVLLTGIVPARHAVNAPVTSPVTASFSASVTAASAGKMQIFSRWRGRRAGTLDGAGTATLSFRPAQPFAAGEQLSVSLPASMQAPDGNQVRKQVVQFTAAVVGTGRHDFVTRSVLPAIETNHFRVGDLDDDGDLDLVVPSGNTGIVRYLNDGAGNFTSASTISGPAAANLLELGDLDADGDLDLLSTAYNGQAVVWRNNGPAGFSIAGNLYTGGYAGNALVDADADGDLDLLALRGNVVSTFYNNGSGIFSAQQDSYPGVAGTSLLTGDVDNDGDIDLLILGTTGGSSQRVAGIALNDGNGVFSASASLPPVAGIAAQAALADLDADGDLDLVTSVGYQESLNVRLNDGQGRFGNSIATLSLVCTSLAIADADSDGDLDIITHAGVALNDGAARFPRIVATPEAGLSASLALVADLDGDQDLDLLTNDQQGAIRVKLNRPGPPPTVTELQPGSGPVGGLARLVGANLQTVTGVVFNGVPAISFTAISPTQVLATVPAGATTGPVVLTTPAGTATAPGSFVVTQPLAVTGLAPRLNANNVAANTPVTVTLSRAAGAGAAAELHVFGNRHGGRRQGTTTGGGTTTLAFTAARPYAAGELVSVTIPDRLTGADGSHALRQTQQFRIAATGTGTGLMMPLPNGRSVAAYQSRYGFAVGDVDNDGTTDLLTTAGMVRFNDGEGGFADSLAYALFIGDSPRQVALADVDADGDLDLLSSSGHLCLNTGSRTFDRQPRIRGLYEDTPDFALGDLDADGDLDIVAPNAARDSVQALFNDGAGHFAARLGVAVGGQSAGISLGDLDNDGDLDFVVANESGPGTGTGSTLSIGLNNGTGWFAQVQTVGAGTGLTRVVLGDLDNDYDLDLVTNNGLVLLNNGTGAFAGGPAAPAGTGLALADLDADGDLDLVVTAAAATLVRRNNGLGQFSGNESLAAGDQLHDPTLADLDGDGDQDLLVADSGSLLLHSLLNQRLAAPAGISVSPTSDLPGAVVFVTGADLIGTTSVTFNGTPAPDFTVLTASRLAVRVPPGASSGIVQVVNTVGAANSAGVFTVLQPVAVVSTSPLRQATAPRTAPVVVGFGQAQPVHTPANLAIFSQRRGGLLAGARSGAGSSTLTFTPTQPYEPGERISVSVPPATVAGQSRVVRRVFQFTAAVEGTGRGFLGAASATQDGDRQVLPADVDNDGDQDLLLLGELQVMLKRNNGTGTFGPSTPVLVSTSQAGLLGNMAVGDIDGDGDLDLAVTNASADVVHLRLNNGNGTFTAAPDVSVADRPIQVVLADFDADGDQDLLTANSGEFATTTSLRLNNGSGSFGGTTNEVLYPDGYAAVGLIRVGDLDNDGDLDLVMTYSITNYVRLNDGQGHFTSAERLPFSQDIGASSLHLADADNDGDLDVLALSWRDTVGNVHPLGQSWLNVVRNDGAGNFRPGGFWAGRGMDGMTVGDLDADGDTDLVTISSGFSTAEVLANDGAGRFALRQGLPTLSRQYNPTLADIDRDGDLDLLQTYPYFVVHQNNVPPSPTITSFTPAIGPEGTVVQLTGSNFVGVSAVRFNGVVAPGFLVNSATQLTVRVPAGASTGRLTVVTAGGTATSASNFTVQVLAVTSGLVPGPNAGSVSRAATLNLTFSAPITAATAGNMRVFGSQLRGRRPGVVMGGGSATLRFDPDQDFAAGERVSVSLPASMQTTTAGIVRKQVYQFTAATSGAGRGFFRPGVEVPLRPYTYALATGDLDNDGDLDVLTSTETNGVFGVGVLLNDGQARLLPGPVINTGNRTAVWHIEAADVDGDSDLDVVASAGTLSPVVCLNNGNATFAPPRFITMNCDWFALGDMDADGDLDLVAAASGANLLTVALNDGQGYFTALPTTLSAPSAVMVVLVDVDRDGDLDALTANQASGMQQFLNDGDGVLVAGTSPRVPGAPQSLAVGDLDSDGDADLAVGYTDFTSGGWVAILANNGSGEFTRTGTPLAAGSVGQIVLGDLDQDEDLDLAVTDAGSSLVRVQLNNGGGSFSTSQSVAVPGNPARLLLADFDTDGDLDLGALPATSSASQLSIRLNEAQPLSGLAAKPKAHVLTLYPNPAHSEFTLIVPDSQRRNTVNTVAVVRLYNTVGNLVLEQEVPASASGRHTMQVAHLPAGMYAVHLIVKGEAAVSKIVLR